MALILGEKVGPYEVISQLGEGGMGEVYRAHDSRLHRSVALKVICLTGSTADRVRRFEQEARSIAALNHPNIVAIYDVGTHQDSPYLVTELLEGETLRERIQRGPMPVRKAMEVATQIAQALSAAHERGIVHRDLKPENIFLTKGGHTKLLDFGLAKEEAAAASAIGSSPTLVTSLTSPGTTPGTVMGTVGYMSPEQVRGLPADYRSDIFSFGTVLYEMLTGRRAFTGASSVETMNAILTAEPPDIDVAATHISPGLERIVRHCMEKNPAERFQSARDLSFALGALSGSETSISGPSQATAAVRKTPWWLWAAAAMLGTIALFAVLQYFYPRSAANSQRMAFSVPTNGEVSHIALSSDGTMLAYVSPCETGEYAIFVQHVGSLTGLKLAGTEGAEYPFFSPDNQYIAFFSSGRLRKVPVAGGAPIVLTSVLNARGGTWGKKNVIVYAPDATGPLWRIEADGSNARPLTDKVMDAGGVTHRWPVFLPDGEHFLFVEDRYFEISDPNRGTYLSDLRGQKKKLLISNTSGIGYANQKLLYLDDKLALLALDYKPNSDHVSGKPQVIAETVGLNPSTSWAAFAASENGTVLFHTGAGAPLSQLTWVDRTGKVLGTVGDPGILANVSISPDQNRVVFDLANRRENNVDVWTYNLQNGNSARFTFDPSEETTGIWSRDGKVIAYRGIGSAEILRVKNSSGLQKDAPLTKMSPEATDLLPNSWSIDDKYILATMESAKGGLSLVLVTVSDGTVAPFLEGGSKANGQISPDGKWVAYESNETGEWEIFITTFPTPGGKLQVSRTGGRQPRWRGDGKEIYYIDPRGALTSVPVATDPSLSTGAATPLFATYSRPYVSSTDLFTYDVARDGSRFLVDRYYRPATVPPLNIILNATEQGR